MTMGYKVGCRVCGQVAFGVSENEGWDKIEHQFRCFVGFDEGEAAGCAWSEPAESAMYEFAYFGPYDSTDSPRRRDMIEGFSIDDARFNFRLKHPNADTVGCLGIR